MNKTAVEEEILGTGKQAEEVVGDRGTTAVKWWVLPELLQP